MTWEIQTTRELVRVTEAGEIRCTEDGTIRVALTGVAQQWPAEAQESPDWTAQSQEAPAWTEQ